MERKRMIAPSVGCCDLFHVEEQVRVINENSDFLHMDIKELGCKAGVALSPSVPLSTIEYYLPLLDKVTIMIVDPGIAGQPVDPQMFVKIRQLAQIRKERGLDFLIEADGSMNKDLYRRLYEAGADLVVLGPPALWNKSDDFQEAWDIMEKELETELEGAERQF